jgi:hypothetical protein
MAISREYNYPDLDVRDACHNNSKKELLIVSSN